MLKNFFCGDICGSILNSIVYHIILRKTNIFKHIVIFIKKQSAAFFKALHNFELCFFYVFSGTKVFYMAGAYAGYNRNIRLCRNGKLADFSKVHHTEFQHHCFNAFVKFQNGFGNAHFVIKIIFCFKGLIPAFYNRGNHFSGGGFAYGTCYRHNFWAEFAAVKPRNIQKSLTGGFHKKKVICSVISFFLHHCPKGAVFHGSFYKGVAVKSFSAKGNKNASGFNITGIRADICYINIRNFFICFCAGRFGNLFKF